MSPTSSYRCDSDCQAASAQATFVVLVEIALIYATPMLVSALMAYVQQHPDVIDPNKLHHIFDNPSHYLEPIVERLGSQEAALRAI